MLSHPSRPNWHFELLAPVYDWMALSRDDQPILEGLNLSSGARLLDLAGGTGSLLKDFEDSKVLEISRGYLFDRSSAMLRQARKKQIQNLISGDSTALPLKNSSFDGVFVGDALHHMDRVPEVLEEVRRVLRDGGRFVIEEFDPGTVLGKLLYWIEWLTGMKSRFYRPVELVSILRDIGFSQVKIEQDGFVYYLTAYE